MNKFLVVSVFVLWGCSFNQGPHKNFQSSRREDLPQLGQAGHLGAGFFQPRVAPGALSAGGVGSGRFPEGFSRFFHIGGGKVLAHYLHLIERKFEGGALILDVGDTFEVEEKTDTKLKVMEKLPFDSVLLSAATTCL